MFRQILVGLDGSEKAKTAARLGCDLARHYAGTVTFVHVLPDQKAAYLDDDPLAEYEIEKSAPSISEMDGIGQRILDAGLQIAEQIGCKHIETAMPQGDAATEILDCADRIGADLIITGRRGLGSVSGLLLGSTSQRVILGAKCACLTVP